MKNRLKRIIAFSSPLACLLDVMLLIYILKHTNWIMIAGIYSIITFVGFILVRSRLSKFQKSEETVQAESLKEQQKNRTKILSEKEEQLLQSNMSKEMLLIGSFLLFLFPGFITTFEGLLLLTPYFREDVAPSSKKDKKKSPSINATKIGIIILESVIFIYLFSEYHWKQVAISYIAITSLGFIIITFRFDEKTFSKLNSKYAKSIIKKAKENKELSEEEEEILCSEAFIGPIIIFTSGVFLLLPGFLSTFFGLFMVFPFTKKITQNYFKKEFQRRKELSQKQVTLKGREEELVEKKAQLANDENKIKGLELNLSEKEDIFSNEQQAHQNTLKQLDLKVEELQELEASYEKLALQEKRTISEKATLETEKSLLDKEFEAFRVLTTEQQEKKPQQIEDLSNKQKELHLNLAATQEKNQLVLKLIREFCHQLMAFFQERNSCFSPKLSRFTQNFSAALREITCKESAVKDSFSSYLETERFLLLDFLHHLEQSLSSEIKYQYQQEITKKKIHLQKLQQENQLIKVKLDRLIAQKTELIHELKKTTTKTIESLRQESVQFFQHLKVLFRKVPKARVVKTANIQLQDFCMISNEHHQELLQKIIADKFKYLFARLPWSEPIQVKFSSSSFGLKEFQANMQREGILTLFMQLSYFFPLLFSSYWPNQKLALFQYQEKLLQKGKEILEPLFVAQVKQAKKTLLGLQTQHLPQLEIEYNLQLEKNSRKIQNLETEYLICQLQIDQLTQRLKEIKKIQLGIRLLLQKVGHNASKELGHLEI